MTMIALRPPDYVAEEIMRGITGPDTPASPGFIPEKPEDLHVTLLILDELASPAVEVDALLAVVQAFAESWPALELTINGIGRFTQEEEEEAPLPEDGERRPDPLFANVDCPHLPRFRHELAQALKMADVDTPAPAAAPSGAGAGVNTDHGYTPHMTLGYLSPDAPTPSFVVQPTTVYADAIHLHWGGQHTAFPLTGSARTPLAASAEAATDNPTALGLPAEPRAPACKAGAKPPTAAPQGDSPDVPAQVAPDTPPPDESRSTLAASIRSDTRGGYEVLLMTPGEGNGWTWPREVLARDCPGLRRRHILPRPRTPIRAGRPARRPLRRTHLRRDRTSSMGSGLGRHRCPLLAAPTQRRSRRRTRPGLPYRPRGG